MKHTLGQVPTIASVLCIAMLAGCSKQAAADRAMSRADEFYDAGQYQAALIEYGNVIQSDPLNQHARTRTGMIYDDQGRWSVAAPLLMAAMEATPDDLEVRVRVGRLYRGGGYFAKAREQAEYILQQQPANADALILLVETANSTNDIDAARQLIASLKERAGDDPAFHIAQATLLYKEDRLEAAQQEIQLALSAEAHRSWALLVEGAILEASGDQEGAAASYERSFEAAPPASIRRIQWPTYLLESGRAEEARDLLVQVTEENPNSVWAMVPLARVEIALGNLAEAEQLIQTALALDPGHSMAVNLFAEVKLLQGKGQEAEAILQTQLRQNPQDYQLFFQLARVQLSKNNRDGAIASLNRVVELNPGLIRARRLLAELYLAQSDLASAQVQLDELVERRPDDRSVLLLQASAHVQARRFDEAATIHRRLLASNPKDTMVGFQLGQVYLLQGKRVEARRTFEDVIANDPSAAVAVGYLADLDIAEDNLDAALDRATAQVDQHPDSAAAHYVLGQVHLAREDYDAAEAEYRKVIELLPDQPNGYLALAKLYAQQPERISEALDQLESLHTKDPEAPIPLLRLALMTEAQGDKAAAAEWYEGLLRVQPNNLYGLNNLAVIYSYGDDKLDRALTLASAARDAAPSSPAVADTLGWVLLRKGDYTRALALIRDAARALPAEAEVLYHLGVAWYMNGKEREAVQSLEDALRVGGDFAFTNEVDELIRVLNIEEVDEDESALQVLSGALAKSADDPIALRKLAAFYVRNGEIERARELCESAYSANSSSLPVLLELIEVSLLSEDHQTRALELAEKARKLAPTDPDVSRVLGKLALRQGDFRRALSLLEESATKAPQNQEILGDLALAYYSVGRLQDAQRTLQRLTQSGAAQPESTQRFLEMLSLQQNLVDPTQARDKAEALLESEPDNVPAQMVLGLAAEQQAEFQAARTSFESVLEAFPQFVPAMKRLAVLTGDQLSDDDAAYEYGVRAREFLPDDLELARTLGKVSYRRGDYLYAAQLLRETVAANPQDADVLYHLGMSQWRLEMSEVARQNLARALELQPDHPMAREAEGILGRE